MLNQPTVAEIKTFLDWYQNLLDFDGMTRHVRGYGAAPPEGFENGPFPVLELERVAEWLRDFVPPSPADPKEVQDAILLHGNDIRELLHDPEAQLSIPTDGNGLRIEARVHHDTSPHEITYTCTVDGLHHVIKIQVLPDAEDFQLSVSEMSSGSELSAIEDDARTPAPMTPAQVMADLNDEGGKSW